MLALIYIIFDTISNCVITDEAFGRMISMTTLTLKRSIWFREKTLAGQRAFTKVAHKARVMVVVVFVKRHLLASVKTLVAFFAEDIQRVHHFFLFLKLTFSI